MLRLLIPRQASRLPDWAFGLLLIVAAIVLVLLLNWPPTMQQKWWVLVAGVMAVGGWMALAHAGWQSGRRRKADPRLPAPRSRKAIAWRQLCVAVDRGLWVIFLLVGSVIWLSALGDLASVLFIGVAYQGQAFGMVPRSLYALWLIFTAPEMWAYFAGFVSFAWGLMLRSRLWPAGEKQQERVHALTQTTPAVAAYEAQRQQLGRGLLNDDLANLEGPLKRDRHANNR